MPDLPWSHLLAMLVVCVALVAGGGPGVADGNGPRFVFEERAAGLRLDFDRDGLAGLPLTEYVTSTVWTESVDRYTGVLLRDLLLSAGIDPGKGPGQVTVEALDGYSASIGFEEITTVAPMVAFLRNGREMPLRAQGPFWLLFPFDDDPSFQNETTYARSVWQISHLRVER
ncbi:MAG: molybdopterin-dependent oxidoreductase [Alkalilacustris sp.]